MVAPPIKTVTFADDVVGSGGGKADDVVGSRGGSSFSRNAYNAAPKPPNLWGSEQFFAYTLDGGYIQPTTAKPQPSSAYLHIPFEDGIVTCPRKAFGLAFGFPNQQSNGTSGHASSLLFGAPQFALGSNGSSSTWGQGSATSNLSGSSSIVGCGQAVVDNLKVGSRKSPYSPTTETEVKCRSSPEKVTSISAMHVHSKSHEELRLEDYQHQRSQGTSFLAAENSTNMYNGSFQFGAFEATPFPKSSSRSSFGNSTIASQSSISASTSCPASGNSTVAPLSSISASTSSSAFGSFTVAPLSSVSASTSSGHSTNKSNQNSTLADLRFRAINRPWQKQPHPNGINIRDADDSCVPKGLEVIAKSLGFNPWSGKDNADKLETPVGGVILSCVQVDKDEDIIALAEFAVEQHKALHMDDRTTCITFSKVVVACLEPFQGGRYHIVLDTVISGLGFLQQKRHYAVVLRKCTQRANCLTVLEKWL